MKSVNVKLDKNGWPDSIPWPTRGEYTCNELTDGHGRCCVSAWAAVALMGRPRYLLEYFNPATRAIERRMMQLATKRGFRSYMSFNDHPDTTDANREEFWRETWEHFGYRGPR